MFCVMNGVRFTENLVNSFSSAGRKVCCTEINPFFGLFCVLTVSQQIAGRVSVRRTESPLVEVDAAEMRRSCGLNCLVDATRPKSSF